jgi:hypothetical protein
VWFAHLLAHVRRHHTHSGRSEKEEKEVFSTIESTSFLGLTVVAKRIDVIHHPHDDM